jgi:predicted nucleic acid-binding protein
MILIDSSVVLDLVLNDPNWAEWSQSKLEAADEDQRFAINEIVYAEVSIGYKNIADLEAMMAIWRLEFAPIPRQALFRAGKAYRQYKSRGGARTGVLP